MSSITTLVTDHSRHVRCLEKHLPDINCLAIASAARPGARIIELHTGLYAEASDAGSQDHEFCKLHATTDAAGRLNLKVNAGHGLNYQSVVRAASIPAVVELDIGHWIVAQPLVDGLTSAMQAMQRLMNDSQL